ncbi:MAG: hypothetical protein ACKPKO_27235, partial [Candidatus Fonsibacter sp.]
LVLTGRCQKDVLGCVRAIVVDEGGTQVGGHAKFVGIVWDSRAMGESSARPSVRMPPLQIMEVHKLFKCIRSRQDRSSETTKVLHPYELYISITGGRD